MLLKRDFYTRDNVVLIAKELIGKVLFSKINGELTAGIITETEAYCGRDDKACHANNNLRTNRTEIMYQEGGVAYIYLCYGIHHLFNVVTNVKNVADAVLIRSLQPLHGIETMKKRRKSTIDNLCNGPGKLTQALGIKTSYNKTDLLGNTIWIEDLNIDIKSKEIRISKRIGVEYAGEDAEKLWRFYVNSISV